MAALFRCLSFGAVLVGLMAVWTPLQAKAFPDEPYSMDEGIEESHVKRFHLWGEIALFVGDRVSGDAHAVSPLFGMRLQFTEEWILDAQWGFVQAKVNNAANAFETSFRLANPYIGINYQGTKDSLSYRLGVGATVPLATLPDQLNRRTIASAAYLFAAAMRGNWNYWLWDPQALSLVIPMYLERRKASGFIWGVALDLGVMISVKKSDNPATNAIIQMAGDLGYQVIRWLRVGSRFSLVIIPRLNPSPGQSQETQLAAEPYVRIGFEDRFVALRLLVNLDDPHGFGFDSNKIWGLRIGGGFAF